MPLLKEADPRLLEELINRMKRIEGQARGVQRMLAEGAGCDAVVLQLSAMKEALGRVGIKLVTCQLGCEIAEEIRQGGSGKEAAGEMTETFLRLS
ncbi:MAG TPA: metal-sensitive transcriptional regulator [Symbiobacteriaceae bacterium]|nr:metal-sensitive transcriptional regulator [Symbiobacteriaceae bacterium]